MRRLLRRLRDVWIYFKTGHSTYLTFVLGLINFVVLQYRLLISTIPSLSTLITSLSSFAVIFVITYVPTAILLGRFEYAKGEITRKPKLNLYGQDSLQSGFLLRDALTAHFKGDDDRAMKLMAESNRLLEKWKK